jgi:hypothetical protein
MQQYIQERAAHYSKRSSGEKGCSIGASSLEIGRMMSSISNRFWQSANRKGSCEYLPPPLAITIKLVWNLVQRGAHDLQPPSPPPPPPPPPPDSPLPRIKSAEVRTNAWFGSPDPQEPPPLDDPPPPPIRWSARHKIRLKEA